MKKGKGIKKKILFIILICILIIASFFLGRQNGISSASDSSTTTTTVTEETVGTQTIQQTLTSSGQISSSETEQLSLSTSKYFKTMCVEEDDTVEAGENILKYSNGTYLTADRDCVIISYSVPETGEQCTSDNYVEVQYLDVLSLSLSISETEIQSVEVGQEVEITLTSDETKTYTGEITKIDSVGTYSSSGSTFGATVEFENDGDIKIGMTASCTVILEEATDVIAVPIEAVYDTDDGRYVVCVNEDGTTENVTVETGISDDSYVEITSGLSGGETIKITTTVTVSTSSSDDTSDSESSFMSMGGGTGDMSSMGGTGDMSDFSGGGAIGGGSAPQAGGF